MAIGEADRQTSVSEKLQTAIMNYTHIYCFLWILMVATWKTQGNGWLCHWKTETAIFRNKLSKLNDKHSICRPLWTTNTSVYWFKERDLWPKSNRLKNSVIYWVSSKWNSLPTHLKQIRSKQSFKKISQKLMRDSARRITAMLFCLGFWATFWQPLYMHCLGLPKFWHFCC